jgi:SAM-dependent methyltransferase
MNLESQNDRWAAGNAYEAFMGRWSRSVAEQFVRWLEPEPAGSWLEVGCGTGALTEALIRLAEPARIVACDPAAPLARVAERNLVDPRVSVVIAGADQLPEAPHGFNAVVSGLALNFLPGPHESLVAMRKRTRTGGTVAAYVWDYSGRMEFLRVFWDEAAALDVEAGRLDEGKRFPLCRPEALHAAFDEAGFDRVRTGALDITTRFASFADYWQPFLGGTGPAPAYVASLDSRGRADLRARLERRLTPRGDGPFELMARAWAVRGTAGDRQAG